MPIIGVICEHKNITKEQRHLGINHKKMSHSGLSYTESIKKKIIIFLGLSFLVLKATHPNLSSQYQDNLFPLVHFCLIDGFPM